MVPFQSYARHSVSDWLSLVTDVSKLGHTGNPKSGPMQDSPYEIKEKLLRALDKEYNVVDMPAVYEVISLLEKALITKEALEKTRIGKYINELRKRTDDDQLSKRAKELVKSWRKLLPAGEKETLVNGEKSTNNARVSPMSVATLGLGPGPGPGSKHPKLSATAPNNTRYKSSSPAGVSEHSTSPFSSSASNSPLLSSSKLQGSNRPATPSSYAPLPKSAVSSASVPRTNRTNVCGKALINTGNHCKTVSNQIFQPVSPALTVARQGISRVPTGNTIECLSQPNPLSPRVSPNSNNFSHSQGINASPRAVPNKDAGFQVNIRQVCQSTVSIPTSGIHSIVDVAKNNVANKRLRKDHNSICNSSVQKKKLAPLNNSDHSRVFNGIDLPEPLEKILPSESSAFQNIKSLNVAKSQKTHGEEFELRPEKRRRLNNSSGMVCDLIGIKEPIERSETLNYSKGKVCASSDLKLDKRKKGGKLEVVNNIAEKPDLLGSSSKLPKVKTPEHTMPENQLVIDGLKPEKKKKPNEKGELHDLLKEKLDKLGSCVSGSKLPKVKTTQQLLADLQAKKGTLPDLLNIGNILSNNVSEPNIGYLSSGSANLHSSDAEVSRTKSELMEKFLQSSGPPCINSDNTTPTAISDTSSPFRDCTPHNCVDSCSVISTDKDVSVACGDPVSEEINQILSQLPPLNVEEINFDDGDYVPQRLEPVTDEHVDRMSRPWKGVNGVSDSSGNFRPWQDCCDVESNGENFRILPYVNIDW